MELAMVSARTGGVLLWLVAAGVLLGCSTFADADAVSLEESIDLPAEEVDGPADTDTGTTDTDAAEDLGDGCGVDRRRCGGQCVDIAFSAAHCGDCETVCAPSQACFEGQCRERCPEGFVWIEAGDFLMGSPYNEWGHPQEQIDGDTGRELRHPVSLSHDFCMMRYEMTQAQYVALMGENPSRHDDCGEDCPVESVSWHMAAAVANAMSARDGRAPCYDCDGEGDALRCDYLGSPYACAGYRLPTEAEWEYATRAGVESALSAGRLTVVECTPLDPVVDAVAWYCANAAATYASCKEGVHEGMPACIGPQPVGGKAANHWGLHDVHGNLNEWTNDVFAWYHAGWVRDPWQGGTGQRTIRGGSFDDRGASQRSAARWPWDDTTRSHKVGVRLALRAPCWPAARHDRSCNGVDDDCNGVVDDEGDLACAASAQCLGGRCVPRALCERPINQSPALFTRYGGHLRVPHHEAFNVQRGLTLELAVEVGASSSLHLRTLMHKRYGDEKDEWRSFLFGYWDYGQNRNVLFGLNRTKLETPRGTMVFGRWVHLAATYDGAQMSIYIDGVLAARKPFDEDIIATGEALEIAARAAIGAVSVDGTIDEVRLWNVARSAEEIRDFMRCSLSAPFPPGLIAYYRLDEGAGDVAHDATSNGLHAELVGHPAWVGHY